VTPDKSDILYGTLGLLVIRTLEALGPLHGYRIARRIEQISGNQLALNQAHCIQRCSSWSRWGGFRPNGGNPRAAGA
jgi:hypothetical protein